MKFAVQYVRKEEIRVDGTGGLDLSQRGGCGTTMGDTGRDDAFESLSCSPSHVGRKGQNSKSGSNHVCFYDTEGCLANVKYLNSQSSSGMRSVQLLAM